MSAKTHSELLFEQYLRSLPLDSVYEPEMPGRKKHPDYRVEITGRHCWFEIKELTEPEEVPKGGFDPTPPFKEKIDQARKPFAEFKECSCGWVLHGFRRF